MHDWLVFDITKYVFAAAVLVGAVSGYFGVFVVQRRMAFLGSGLAHAAFGGVALGILLELEPLLTAFPYTLAVALAIVWVRERTELAEDTAIGVLFAVSMACGIVFVNLKPGFVGDATAYLYGSILSVTGYDVVLAAALALSTAATAPLWGTWAYATFDRNLARSDRLPVVRHDYALAVALTIVVVVSIKIIGMLLLSAFLVLPAATARLFARSLRHMTALAIAIGAVTPALGILLSIWVDLPPGAVIILVQAALFAAALTRAKL